MSKFKPITPPENHSLLLRHMHLGIGVSHAGSLADLRTVIIIACHAHLANLVPCLFHTLPMLYLRHMAKFERHIIRVHTVLKECALHTMCHFMLHPATPPPPPPPHIFYPESAPPNSMQKYVPHLVGPQGVSV